jgi:hypothetical protein
MSHGEKANIAFSLGLIGWARDIDARSGARMAAKRRL